MPKYKEVDNQLVELVNQNKSARQIAKILNIGYTTVHKKLRKLGLNLYNFHNELKFDNTVFDVIDTEEKAYWLGFLYADGYVSKNPQNHVELSLKGSDYLHLEKFKTFLKHSSPIKLGKAKCQGKEYSRCRFCVTNQYFKKRLVELGCTPQKSLTLKFPNIEIFKCKNLVYDFIRGYVDGDGCLTYTSSGRLNIEIIGTKEFLEGVVLYLPQFKNPLNKDKRHLESNTFFMTCTANKADEVANILYKNATVYLNRKYERYCRLVQK